MTKTTIPGNRYSEFGRIHSDTTREALVKHLDRLTGSQAANMRTNPRYRAEVRRLRLAIAARTH